MKSMTKRKRVFAHRINGYKVTCSLMRQQLLTPKLLSHLFATNRHREQNLEKRQRR